MKVTIQDSRTSITVEPRDFRVTVSGARGPAGAAGVGIAAGGAEGQILAKASATDYDTEWIDNFAPNVEVYVKNSSGSPMTKGQVVYISGADGTNPTISLAIATSEMGSSKTIGWLKQDLVQGAFGYVITEGLLEGINTNAAGAAGDPVWLSPTTAGGVVYGIANKPSAPNHLVFLGYVLRKQINNGKVYVKVQNGFELGELHDVYNGAKTTPVANDALLLRDSADSNLWKRLTWTNALAGVKSHMDTFKSVANGYASLDGSGKVPASELPSYVDDVIEVANYAALPGTGETGKIYVTLDTNKCYRWSGSVYVEVSAGGASAWGAITGTLSSQTDLQTALDGKVDENAAITGATKTKITYDAKGLVTAGTDAAITDINGLQTALDGKQSTLSLTTTGTSGAATLVGSTLNIPQYQGVLTNPVTGTGTSGQVAFFNGTSAVTGSTNLFWDNANGRLGVGTASPGEKLSIQTTTSSATNNIIQAYSNSGAQSAFRVTDQGTGIFRVLASIGPISNNGYGAVGSNYYVDLGSSRRTSANEVSVIEFPVGGFQFKSSGSGAAGSAISFTTTMSLNQVGDLGLGISTTTPSARLHIRGSGTTSATTALLVQNSNSTEYFRIYDNGEIYISGRTLASPDYTTLIAIGTGLNNSPKMTFIGKSNIYINSSNGIEDIPSALLAMGGTTKGFLPPRMTTTQRDAIATPAAGLIVYNNTNSSIDLYTSAWRSLVSTSNYDGMNIAFGTTTGTKIGTATNQLIGFWNATPIVQPTTAVAAATRVGGAGNTVTDTDTFDGYTIAQLVKALRNMGALA